MSPRFRMALLSVLALAAGFGLAALLLGAFSGKDPAGPDGAGLADGQGPGTGPGTMIEGTGPDGGTDEGTPEGVRIGRPETGLDTLVGARTPSGIDLTDPATREREMGRLIRKDPVDWAALARLVALHEGNLPAAVRESMLRAIARAGSRRNVLQAFKVLRDGTLVPDLVQFLDQPDLDHNAYRAVLQALSSMPGGDHGEIARAMESRLKDDAREDQALLAAICSRGGPESARAIVEYIQRVDQPQRINHYILRGLRISEDPEAAAIVKDALATRGLDPEVQLRLLDVASQAGATVLTEAVIEMDQNGAAENVRKRALQGLAQIGGEKALGYLLEKAKEPGALGEAAILSIGHLSRADEKGQKALLDALEKSSENPRAALYQQQLVSALGNLKQARNGEKLVAYVASPEVGVKRAAIDAIGKLGTKGQPHVPALVEEWADGDETTRSRVAVALGTIGGTAAVNALEQMKGAPDLTPSLVRTINAAITLEKKRRNAGGTDGPRGVVLDSRRPGRGR